MKFSHSVCFLGQAINDRQIVCSSINQNVTCTHNNRSQKCIDSLLEMQDAYSWETTNRDELPSRIFTLQQNKNIWQKMSPIFLTRDTVNGHMNDVRLFNHVLHM